MKRQWYYRGSLKSCNYTCSYCPFSKRKGNEREWQRDKEAFFRFVERMSVKSFWEKNAEPSGGISEELSTGPSERGSGKIPIELSEKITLHMAGKPENRGAVMVTPYGEALIHSYYWEGLAALSRNPRLDAVGCQSNFSFPVEKMLSVYCRQGGVLEKLRLWGTFHPEMTTVEKFVHQCQLLSERRISYCVGAVGVPEQLEDIRRLREALPDSVYLWINKMDGLGRAYTDSEIEAFLEIDEYFELELAHHRADITQCTDNRFVEADGTMCRCNICRQRLGNFYEHFPVESDGSVSCTRKECSCYLAYCNRKEEQLLFFQPYPAFRIPVYPRAAFFDVDGTLIPKGQGQIPSETVRRLIRLAHHCDIYLATSLPYEIARRRTAPVWPVLSGGVFANGGRNILLEDKGLSREVGVSGGSSLSKGGEGLGSRSLPKGETCTRRSFFWDEIEGISTDWLGQAEKQRTKYGFTLHTYKKGNDTYKVTLVFRKGRLPEKMPEGYLDELVSDLGIPDSCQLLREDNCIQITRKGTGKLEGILEICRKVGYQEEDVVVFGDSENDIPMLEYFFWSVRVGNC